jgi:hypothetical protein
VADVVPLWPAVNVVPDVVAFAAIVVLPELKPAMLMVDDCEVL